MTTSTTAAVTGWRAPAFWAHALAMTLAVLAVVLGAFHAGHMPVVDSATLNAGGVLLAAVATVVKTLHDRGVTVAALQTTERQALTVLPELAAAVSQVAAWRPVSNPAPSAPVWSESVTPVPAPSAVPSEPAVDQPAPSVP